MSDSLVLKSTVDGVTTLTMNNPAKLNGWTMEMMMALRQAIVEAGRDEATKALVLTGGRRRHSTIGYLAPAEYERRHLERTKAKAAA